MSYKYIQKVFDKIDHEYDFIEGALYTQNIFKMSDGNYYMASLSGYDKLPCIKLTHTTRHWRRFTGTEVNERILYLVQDVTLYNGKPIFVLSSAYGSYPRGTPILYWDTTQWIFGAPPSMKVDSSIDRTFTIPGKWLFLQTKYSAYQTPPLETKYRTDPVDVTVDTLTALNVFGGLWYCVDLTGDYSQDNEPDDELKFYLTDTSVSPEVEHLEDIYYKSTLKVEYLTESDILSPVYPSSISVVRKNDTGNLYGTYKDGSGAYSDVDIGVPTYSVQDWNGQVRTLIKISSLDPAYLPRIINLLYFVAIPNDALDFILYDSSITSIVTEANTSYQYRIRPISGSTEFYWSYTEDNITFIEITPTDDYDKPPNNVYTLDMTFKEYAAPYFQKDMILLQPNLRSPNNNSSEEYKDFDPDLSNPDLSDPKYMVYLQDQLGKIITALPIYNAQLHHVYNEINKLIYINGHHKTWSDKVLNDSIDLLDDLTSGAYILLQGSGTRQNNTIHPAVGGGAYKNITYDLNDFGSQRAFDTFKDCALKSPSNVLNVNSAEKKNAYKKMLGFISGIETYECGTVKNSSYYNQIRFKYGSLNFRSDMAFHRSGSGGGATLTEAKVAAYDENVLYTNNGDSFSAMYCRSFYEITSTGTHTVSFTTEYFFQVIPNWLKIFGLEPNQSKFHINLFMNQLSSSSAAVYKTFWPFTPLVNQTFDYNAEYPTTKGYFVITYPPAGIDTVLDTTVRALPYTLDKENTSEEGVYHFNGVTPSARVPGQLLYEDDITNLKSVFRD